MAASPVHLSLPTWSLFKFPPASLPKIVPPPTSDFTYANPFQIPTGVYNHLLHVAYPLTAALLYSAVVTFLNRINSQRSNQPWAITKTRAFVIAVLAHNIFLAVYSGWTFTGMLQAIKHAWPGLGSHTGGVTGAVDALCKIHGPRGLGNGIMFNSTSNIWSAPNAAINLTPQGIPDNTDLGRMWNEGLGFYGWLFYLSKFYEVVDSLIIVAKGKETSPLQTFHHAGAMLSVWAGIRYMSPPIWLFVFLNSGIHTLMYTYYALTSLGVPIPRWVKQTLTTSQIAQFIIGATYAFAHLFISYSVPTSVPASVASTVASAISAAPSVATSIASSAVTSVASAASAAGIGNILRKVALRAAGEEGLAENIPLYNEKPILSGSGHAVMDKLRGVKEEVKYTTEDRPISCIDTSGQTFAILLNLLYLAPLTYMFVNFWIRSYSKRTSADTRHPTQHSLFGKVTRDAAKGVQRELDENPTPLPEQTEEVVDKARKASERFVTELEKEAVNGADGTEKEMPGTYDGDVQGDKAKKEKTKKQNRDDKGEGEKGDVAKAGKNENQNEEKKSNGDVTNSGKQDRDRSEGNNNNDDDNEESGGPSSQAAPQKKPTDKNNKKKSSDETTKDTKDTKPDEKKKKNNNNNQTNQKKKPSPNNNKPQPQKNNDNDKDKKDNQDAAGADGIDDAAGAGAVTNQADITEKKKEADINNAINDAIGSSDKDKNDEKVQKDDTNDDDQNPSQQQQEQPNGNSKEKEKEKIPETDPNQPTIAKPFNDDDDKKDGGEPTEVQNLLLKRQNSDGEEDEEERRNQGNVNADFDGGSMVMVDNRKDDGKEGEEEKEGS
ncbi:MAG: hypothetical protein M1823_001076 [Watsoniomyces obsoletus]|nr:MAG: hypothetical protein M1823_001076 [Watsoniomyces obsoletus]